MFYEYLVEGSVTKTVSLDSNGKPVEPANCVAKDASTSNEAQTVNVISLETKVLVNSTKTNESPAAINTVTDLILCTISFCVRVVMLLLVALL